MEIKEMFEKYPKAAQIIKDWYINNMIQSSMDAPQEFIEAMKDRIDDMLFSVGNHNPRMLIDFFDEHDIYIFTNFGDGNLFNYKIFTGSTNSTESPLMFLSADNFIDRIEAEKAAITEAMSLLEEKHKND